MASRTNISSSSTSGSKVAAPKAQPKPASLEALDLSVLAFSLPEGHSSDPHPLFIPTTAWNEEWSLGLIGTDGPFRPPSPTTASSSRCSTPTAEEIDFSGYIGLEVMATAALRNGTMELPDCTDDADSQ
ncbi:hypothetical protein NM688_g4572 [Phlebia brevispora]|uniref:Uncharacterized protein n=1 Tax=Phlebia brevispora TaxID=194682 RepID=A0ACC1T2K5_9APHY|nr:hypothetical protein NM688_g4572 [Phlebia brevispora]